MPRYRIEYLTETTEEESVCHVIIPASLTLTQAAEAAFEAFSSARAAQGAGGFQIRVMSTETGEIVALETLDTPLD